MALDAIGLHDRARELFAWVQFLRHDDGSYWTGMNFEGDRFDELGDYYTPEQPTWNSAAVVLAANALGGNGPTSGLFRGEGLPAGLTAQELIDAGAAIEAGRSARAALTLRTNEAGAPAVRYLLWDFGDTLADQRFLWPSPDGAPGWTEWYGGLGDDEVGARWELGELSSEALIATVADQLGLTVEAGMAHMESRSSPSWSSSSTRGSAARHARCRRRSSR